MKVEKKIINKLVEGLEKNKYKIIEIYNTIITSIVSSKTVEEVMGFKQRLLTNLILNLPLNPEECYFCIEHKGEGTCSKCIYGKIHGYCGDENSDFDKINEIRQSLSKELDSYFKDEEDYQESIISKFKVGEEYVIGSKNWKEGELYSCEVTKIIPDNGDNKIKFYFKKTNTSASYYETDLTIYIID
jgi:hypothetical protein